jgi:hypothetical protein
LQNPLASYSIPFSNAIPFRQTPGDEAPIGARAPVAVFIEYRIEEAGPDNMKYSWSAPTERPAVVPSVIAVDPIKAAAPVPGSIEYSPSEAVAKSPAVVEPNREMLIDVFPTGVRLPLVGSIR